MDATMRVRRVLTGRRIVDGLVFEVQPVVPGPLVQTVGMRSPVQPLADPREQFGTGLTICVTPIDVLDAIAAGGDVVEGARKLDAEWTCDVSSLACWRQEEASRYAARFRRMVAERPWTTTSAAWSLRRSQHPGIADCYLVQGMPLHPVAVKSNRA